MHSWGSYFVHVPYIEISEKMFSSALFLRLAEGQGFEP